MNLLTCYFDRIKWKIMRQDGEMISCNNPMLGIKKLKPLKIPLVIFLDKENKKKKFKHE